MKKLLAITVIFALVASVAFAEASVSGATILNITPVAGDNKSNSDMTAGGEVKRLRIQADGTSDSEKFGGRVRLDGTEFFGLGSLATTFVELENPNGVDPSALSGGNGVSGFVWWKPIDMFKLFLGVDPDGLFGQTGVTRWGFHCDDTGVAMQNGTQWGSKAFFSGYDTWAAVITLKPIDILEVNVAVPFYGQEEYAVEGKWENGVQSVTEFELTKKNGKVWTPYENAVVQVAANLDFGTIAVTFEGADQGRVFAYYGSDLTETVHLDVGVGYAFKKDSTIWFGLGAKVDISDAFGLKARAHIGVPQASGDKLEIIADVMPYFAINDDLEARVDLFLNSKDKKLTFGFNPYIIVSGTFFAGVQVTYANKEAAGGADAVMTWSVPIGINFSF